MAATDTTPSRDWACLEELLARNITGFAPPATITSLPGGRSNPNFILRDTAGRRFVLRARPAGPLHPSAHRIDREVRILRALEHSGMPVPRVRLWHANNDPFGSVFYVMDHVAGVTEEDPALPGIAPALRGTAYDDAVRALALLHRLDPTVLGLQDYGADGDYNVRQIRRWTGENERLGANVLLAELARALARNPPRQRRRTIVHGDFRWGNMLLDPARGAINAVLDWELSTLGDPLADLAYFTLPYLLPRSGAILPGLEGLDLAQLSLPSITRTLAQYCELSGEGLPPDWPAHLGLALLRFGAICLGVVVREAAAAGADPAEDQLRQVDTIAAAGLSILAVFNPHRSLT